VIIFKPHPIFITGKLIFQTHTMKNELHSAANFIVHLLRLAKKGICEPQLEKFQKCLINAMRMRYRDFWFPEKPFKGIGYRTIRINDKLDPLISRAGEACGLSSAFLKEALPEMTMWIDPLEVSYRFGENSPIYVFYDKYCLEPWTHNHSPNRIPKEPLPAEENNNKELSIEDIYEMLNKC